jgi:hypothetical protein
MCDCIAAGFFFRSHTVRWEQKEPARGKFLLSASPIYGLALIPFRECSNYSAKAYVSRTAVEYDNRQCVCVA